MFKLMFLALHHSAHIAIHVLVARAVFLEAAVSFISVILRPIQGENELGLLPLFLCFVEENMDFYRRKNFSVAFQSGECLPPFAVVAKR